MEMKMMKKKSQNQRASLMPGTVCSHTAFFVSDAHSRHPLLELNLQRPVYRNYRLLMNGTLYIHKVRGHFYMISAKICNVCTFLY